MKKGHFFKEPSDLPHFIQGPASESLSKTHKGLNKYLFVCGCRGNANPHPWSFNPGPPNPQFTKRKRFSWVKGQLGPWSPTLFQSPRKSRPTWNSIRWHSPQKIRAGQLVKMATQGQGLLWGARVGIQQSANESHQIEKKLLFEIMIKSNFFLLNRMR